MAAPKVLFVMADYGHDPTETAVPFQEFQKAGFDITFATENGKSPDCDSRMLEGLTQKLLGAKADAIQAYKDMKASPQIQSPLAWTDPAFSFDAYQLIFYPGGHDKGVRQVLDSPVVRAHTAAYFPTAQRGSARSVAAICHGVLCLSEALGAGGKSVIHACKTTTLPGPFESGVHWGTALFLGDYYKTYGKCSENCEVTVKKRLDNPAEQYKTSLAPGPFVVEDEAYNYVTGRYPADAQLLAEKAIELVRAGAKSS